MALAQTLLHAANSVSIAGQGAFLAAWAGMVAGVSAMKPELAPAAWQHPHRRALDELKRMSDADLRDIGISRGDFEAAYPTPIHEDPTEALARIRTDRDGW